MLLPAMLKYKGTLFSVRAQCYRAFATLSAASVFLAEFYGYGSLGMVKALLYVVSSFNKWSKIALQSPDTMDTKGQHAFTDLIGPRFVICRTTAPLTVTKHFP